jgi:hypothetical protein
VTIEIPDDSAATLQMWARARGLSVEQWLLELAVRDLQTSSIAHLQKSDPREWARQFRAWADSHDPSTPVLSDDAMSRDSMYPDRT